MIGVAVEVIVRNVTHGHVVFVPPTSTYSGRVVPNLPWQTKDEIAITSDGKFTRQIPHSRIVSIVKAGQPHTFIPQPATITSIIKDQTFSVKGSTGSVYTVTKTSSNKWRCNCPAGSFGRNCKHVTKIKEQI